MLNLTHQYLIDWSTTISMFVVIIMFLFLFESRYPKKKYFASLIPFSICWFGLNLGILFVCGIEVQGTYSLLTATLPSLIYFFIVAKDRGGRFCLLSLAEKSCRRISGRRFAFRFSLCFRLFLLVLLREVPL